MKVKCRITKTVFSRDDFRIFGCSLVEENKSVKLNKYGSFTIAGSYPYLEEGTDYVMEIEEGKTDRYGTQYSVVDVPSMRVEELTDENELSYLEQITTPHQAKHVHNAYPDFIRKILKGEESEIDVRKIHNVGEYRLNVYIREINLKFKYFAIIAHFPQYKLTIEDAKEVSKNFGDVEKAKEYITNNPYSTLIEFCGRSFERADKLIIEHDEKYVVSEQRAEFMLLWLLDRNEMDGNTRIYANDLAEYIREYDDRLLPIVKTTAINSYRIYFDEKSKDMARADTMNAECNIAYFVKDRVERSYELDLEHDCDEFYEVDGFELSEKQKGLLTNAKKYLISILLGFSGCGKTSSLVGLIKMLEANNLTYTLLAPTGLAAKRMSECTGGKASTIHMRISGDAQITSDFVIIDEFSMVDVKLCNALFKSIDENTRVVIVGDNAQLSSIGCGNVFTNLINSQIIPIAFLDEVFRYNENGMIKIATDIREGNSYFDSDESIQHYGKNFTYIQADNKTGLDTLLNEYRKALKKHKPSEIMVLTPFNVGECGTYNINKIIQAEVNPPKPNQKSMSRDIGNARIIFRVGDHVLNTRNDYKALTLEEYTRLKNLETHEELGLMDDDDFDYENQDKSLEPHYKTIYNGDKGTIRKIDDEKMVIQFDEEMFVYEKNKLNQLLLSYCISTHKSQGGQGDYVINLSLPMHSRMLSSNLIYVACTRSKSTMIEIGDMATIKEAIKIHDQIDRNTFLQDLFVADK